jgi:hypothetical protein
LGEEEQIRQFAEARTLSRAELHLMMFNRSMAILRSIFNSTPINAACCMIGYLSFSCLAFFVACFVCALTVEAAFDKQKVIESVLSPDGKLKAVVYEHANPVRKFRYVNVSVISADAEPERERDGNLFSFSDTSAKVRWIDDEHIRISHAGEHWKTAPFTFIAFDGRSLNVESVETSK